MTSFGFYPSLGFLYEIHFFSFANALSKTVKSSGQDVTINEKTVKREIIYLVKTTSSGLE